MPLVVGLSLLAGQAGTGWRDPSPHTVRVVTIEASLRLEVTRLGRRGAAGPACLAAISEGAPPKIGARVAWVLQ